MNFYTILNIDPAASQDEIKRAYKILALKLHPDKNSHKSENDKKYKTDIFVKLNKSYNVLMDPIKRKIYDEQGINGLNMYDAKQEQEEEINEAKKRNQERKEQRRRKQVEVEEQKKKEEQIKQEEVKRKEEEEEQLRKKLELERLINQQKELKRKELEKLRKQQEVEQRERLLAKKRQEEIDLEIKNRIIEEEIEQNRKQQIFNSKIKNKNECLKNFLNELYAPFRELILKNDYIDIKNIESFILSNIINQSCDLIINFNEYQIKKLYLKLREIKDYYDNDYNDIITNKNIRGKIMLKRFLNLCSDFSIDKYVVEQYEDFLKRKKLYDSDNFYFLKKITEVYLMLIDKIIPDINFYNYC